MSLKNPKSTSNPKKSKVPKKTTKSSTKAAAARASSAKAANVRKIESDESDSSDILSDDENKKWKETKRAVSDPTPEYQNIQKLIRYVKAGNTTATIVSLCCLKDYDLSVPMNQNVSSHHNFISIYVWFVNKHNCHLIELLVRVCVFCFVYFMGHNNQMGKQTNHPNRCVRVKIIKAISEIGGLEVLVNLLESKDAKCQLGALQVLVTLSTSSDVQQSIIDLNGIVLLVHILSEPALNLKTMSAEILSNVARIRFARRLIRRCDGIPKLIDLLDIKLE